MPTIRSTVLLGLLLIPCACGDDDTRAPEASSTSTGDAESTTAMASTGSSTSSADASSTGGGDGSSSESGGAGSSESGGSDSTGSPDAVPCDPIAQDCEDPDAPKCGLRWNNGAPALTECEPQLGDDALGEPCELPNDFIGEDTCLPGLFCSIWGVAEGRACRAICTEGSCDDGEACMVLFGGIYGVCNPTCDFGSDECPDGTTCFPLPALNEQGSAALCRQTGPGELGDDCDGGPNCGDGLMCVSQLAGPITCEQICEIEGEQACPNDALCLPLLDTPGWGFCNPN